MSTILRSLTMSPNLCSCTSFPQDTDGNTSAEAMGQAAEMTIECCKLLSTENTSVGPTQSAKAE
eukprot:4176458-Amphidinium_carterae.1